MPVQCSSRVGVFKSATVGGVVWSWQRLCVWCCRSFTQMTLTGFAKATKTGRAAKWYWRPLKEKKFEEKPSCVKMGEYFLRFKTYFAESIYMYYIF